MLGMLTFLDPPRPDTKHTIEQALENGVDVKMITGDQVRGRPWVMAHLCAVAAAGWDSCGMQRLVRTPGRAPPMRLLSACPPCALQVLIAKEMSRILGLGTNIPDASGLPKLDEDGKVGLGRVGCLGCTRDLLATVCVDFLLPLATASHAALSAPCLTVPNAACVHARGAMRGLPAAWLTAPLPARLLCCADPQGPAEVRQDDCGGGRLCPGLPRAQGRGRWQQRESWEGGQVVETAGGVSWRQPVSGPLLGSSCRVGMLPVQRSGCPPAVECLQGGQHALLCCSWSVGDPLA